MDSFPGALQYEGCLMMCRGKMYCVGTITASTELVICGNNNITWDGMSAPHARIPQTKVCQEIGSTGMRLTLQVVPELYISQKSQAATQLQIFFVYKWKLEADNKFVQNRSEGYAIVLNKSRTPGISFHVPRCITSISCLRAVKASLTVGEGAAGRRGNWNGT